MKPVPALIVAKTVRTLRLFISIHLEVNKYCTIQLTKHYFNDK